MELIDQQSGVDGVLLREWRSEVGAVDAEGKPDCSASGDGIRCTHSAGAVTEEEVVRDGMWLSTTTTSWQLDGYTDELVGRLWP